jgi:hypothetical protein
LTFSNGTSDFKVIWVAGDFPGNHAKQGNLATTMTTVTKVIIVTVVTKVAWGFPTQSLRLAETHVGLYAKFPKLLSVLNQNLECVSKF